MPAPNFRGGACSKFSGGCLLQIFGGVPAPNFRGGLQFSEYGQRSAGTHPTGMHSCFYMEMIITARCKSKRVNWSQMKYL